MTREKIVSLAQRQLFVSEQDRLLAANLMIPEDQANENALRRVKTLYLHGSTLVPSARRTARIRVWNVHHLVLNDVYGDAIVAGSRVQPIK